MFICDPCLDKQYDNVFRLITSYGRCEDCGKTRVCNDIPSDYLYWHMKKEEKPDGSD